MKKAPEKQWLSLLGILTLHVSLCHLSLIHSDQGILQNLRKVHMIGLYKYIQPRRNRQIFSDRLISMALRSLATGIGRPCRNKDFYSLRGEPDLVVNAIHFIRLRIFILSFLLSYCLAHLPRLLPGEAVEGRNARELHHIRCPFFPLPRMKEIRSPDISEKLSPASIHSIENAGKK